MKANRFDRACRTPMAQAVNRSEPGQAPPACDVRIKYVMKRITYSSAVALVLGWSAVTYADHNKSCENIHGKVTVVSEEGVAVNDKMYKITETTRITKGDKVVKLRQISPGDIVCIDERGKHETKGVAAVTVLSLTDPVPVREREYVREKQVVKPASHDRKCEHIHGKVVRINDSTLIVAGKPYACATSTKITKGSQTVTFDTLKAGDFVCIDDGDETSTDHKVTTVMILNPTDAEAFESREIIRERERVKEKIREEK
jgi:hypothetical protein